ncbi:MAG TPA: transcriptional regulator [Planctomycetaceae bacterium]|nr:transcriptional regulator [Planctomycetaceae bacterium]HRF00790.1 ROK family protein [Pirellulaceae bacterium]
MRDITIGCDLGGTKLLVVAFDEQYRPIGRARKKTKGHEGAEAGLKRIGDTIVEALETAGAGPERIRVIGVGCPGPLDLDKGIVHEAPNLGWRNVPMKQVLETRFGCPVTVANDVDMGVFGEWRFGAGKRERCVVGIFPGTGIGGGCVYEGKILRGRNTSCMEIGHIPLIPGGPLDGAGNPGSLEAVASRLRIAAEAAQAAYRGQAPALRKKAGTDLTDIRSGVIAQAIADGDRAVEAIVRQAAEHLGMGIVTVVHLLAPDLIVMGGGLVEAMPKLIVETAAKAAAKRVLPSYRQTFKVVAAELGDDATAMGAASWARQCAGLEDPLRIAADATASRSAETVAASGTPRPEPAK